MIQLLMMLSLSSLTPSQPAVMSQFQPCVYPRVCANAAPIIAQFQPCRWPNTCSEKAPAI